MSSPVRQEPGRNRNASGPRVILTWVLLGIAAAVLLGLGLADFLLTRGDMAELALAIAVTGLAAAAVINARAADIEGQRRNSEAESFSRIMRALSRSVSPDAVVEAIVHELGAATEADHVAVVRMRPGATVLDVTFVSMLPGTPTSNSVMPLRQLEPIAARRVREPASVVQSDRDSRANRVDVANGSPASLGPSDGSRPRSLGSAGDEARAREVAERIAYRLRDAYGLRNTLAAPLLTTRAIAGAIVLSRRTDDAWPEAAERLLYSAAAEASAALARVYLHQAAESEARTDQLTQLPNRRYFDEYCRLLASRRRATDRVAILSVDVDRFKQLNDQHGHQVGDVVLRAIANAIQFSVREEDVPVRFGGEEFLVLLRNPAPGVALGIGERIRQSVRELDLLDVGVTERVTVSVGVASGQHAGEPVDDIVERADRALYEAKRTGRDRVVEARQPGAPQQAPAPTSTRHGKSRAG